MNVPLEFSGYSAFDSEFRKGQYAIHDSKYGIVTKALTLFGGLLSTSAFMVRLQAEQYVDRLFRNANTDYAEVCWLSKQLESRALTMTLAATTPV